MGVRGWEEVCLLAVPGRSRGLPEAADTYFDSTLQL